MSGYNKGSARKEKPPALPVVAYIFQKFLKNHKINGEPNAREKPQ